MARDIRGPTDLRKAPLATGAARVDHRTPRAAVASDGLARGWRRLNFSSTWRTAAADSGRDRVHHCRARSFRRSMSTTVVALPAALETSKRGRRGRLAQLVRAPGLHPGGRGFEPLTAHERKRSRGSLRRRDAFVDEAVRHDGVGSAGGLLRTPAEPIALGSIPRRRRRGRGVRTFAPESPSPTSHLPLRAGGEWMAFLLRRARPAVSADGVRAGSDRWRAEGRITPRGRPRPEWPARPSPASAGGRDIPGRKDNQPRAGPGAAAPSRPLRP